MRLWECLGNGGALVNWSLEMGENWPEKPSALWKVGGREGGS